MKKTWSVFGGYPRPMVPPFDLCPTSKTAFASLLVEIRPWTLSQLLPSTWRLDGQLFTWNQRMHKVVARARYLRGITFTGCVCLSRLAIPQDWYHHRPKETFVLFFNPNHSSTTGKDAESPILPTPSTPYPPWPSSSAACAASLMRC